MSGRECHQGADAATRRDRLSTQVIEAANPTVVRPGAFTAVAGTQGFPAETVAAWAMLEAMAADVLAVVLAAAAAAIMAEDAPAAAADRQVPKILT